MAERQRNSHRSALYSNRTLARSGNRRWRQSVLRLVLLVALVSLWAVAQPAAAGDEGVGDLVEVKLKDGTKLVGEIVQEDEESLTIRTAGGVEMSIPKSSVDSRKAAKGRVKGGKYSRKDPNYARLLFAPTGRPLRQGQGYFTDTYILLPSVAYGITDQISLLVGISIVPFVDIKDQVLYVSPKFGYEFSEKLAVSVGALYVSLWDDVAAGIAFATASLGEPDRSFHAGIGFGFTKDRGSRFDFAEHPVFLLGGNVRVSNGIAFVGETWPILSLDDVFDETVIPFGVAVRIFGEHLAVDLGAITESHLIAEGFPIPWVTVAYNFGG
jgi:hypothetical protein